MKPAFEIKSARLDALCVQLHHTNPDLITAQLKERTQPYRELGLPLLLDLQNTNPSEQNNIAQIIQAFAQHQLPIIAIRHTDASWANFAHQHQLAFSEPLKAEEPKATEPTVLAPINPSKTQSPPTQHTVFVHTPVRTGQQVYAENTDLIVTSMVSEGAEILADGNIHIYGTMRGRVQAGVSGRRDVRIFIQSMQAELVSIAGIYRNFEQDLPNHLHKKPVQIYLQDDNRLVISALGDTQ